jgi:hypothetical protein
MNALEEYPDIKYILGLHEVVVAEWPKAMPDSDKVRVLNLHRTGLGQPCLCFRMPHRRCASYHHCGQNDARFSLTSPT